MPNKCSVGRGLVWERACSRRGQHIQHQCCLTHRFREQARSHMEINYPALCIFRAGGYGYRRPTG
ncbi:hypothetical protein E3W21_16430 [Pseudomonas sp. F01002]|nr:hypothetical protein FQ187_25015 [Pseudomonas sp. ANT_J28]TFB40234.1 hypothetical protein E3W21_16430 [Pseudomonas sp. F01002]